MPDLSIRLLINIFSVLGAALALWKGGTAERLAAVIVIANAMFGEAGHWLAPDAEGVVRLVNDGLTALVLLGVTLRYGAPWMGGVMLFYAAQFSLHSYYLVTGRSDADFLHALINNIDYCGIIWCLIVGTVVAWRARLHTVRGASAA
jgi:hypothetical protein